MVDTDKTLEIVMRVRDFASRVMRRMGQTISRVVRTLITAPIKAAVASVKLLTAAFVGLGTAAIAAFGLFSAGRGFGAVVDAADAMSKLARSLDTSVESLSALETAFGFAGLSGERFTAIVTGLGRGISQSLNTGRGPQFEAFERLGISLQQIRDEDYVSIFGRLASGLENVGTQAERAATLQAIFPDNFQRLLPLLGEGRQAFEDNIELARAYGASLDTDLAQGAERFNDALLKLRTSLADVGRTAILNVAKALTPFLEALGEFVRDNRESLSRTFESLIRVLTRLAIVITKLVIKAFVLLTTRTDDLIDAIAKIPLIGDTLAGALEEVFGERTPAAMRKTKEELQEVTDAIVKEEARIQRFQDQLRRGVEVDGSVRAIEESRGRIDELGERGRRLGDDIDQSRTSPIGSNTAFNSALDQSRLDQFVAMIDKLNPFADRPGEENEFVVGARETVDDVTSEWDRYWTSFDQSADRAIERWSSFQEAGAEAATTLIDNGLNGLTDAFADIITGTKDAKEAFKDFAKAMLADLARIIARLIVVKTLNLVLGNSGGNVDVPVEDSFSGGGLVPRDMIARVHKNEAIVETARGSIPVHFTGDGRGGGGNQVMVQINIQGGAESGNQALQDTRDTVVGIIQDALNTDQGVRDAVVEIVT